MNPILHQDWLVLMQEQTQLNALLAANQFSQPYGLSLTEQQARQLLQEKQHTLREQQRVEFGGGITAKLVQTFCSSPFINQSSYAETISRLQEIFYLFKNEMLDEISDDELLKLMYEQFENLCFGDLDYLANTCLYNFAQAVRAGYGTAADNYDCFDETPRWDYQLYLQALQDIAWR